MLPDAGIKDPLSRPLFLEIDRIALFYFHQSRTTLKIKQGNSVYINVRPDARPMNRRHFLRLASLCSAPIATAVGNQDEVAPWISVVRDFYTFHFLNWDYWGAGLRNKEKWFSRRLTQALRAEEKQGIMKSSSNQIPDYNADPFTGSQEYPNSFTIGESHRNRDWAFVDMEFIWEWKTAEQEVLRNSRMVLVVLRLEDNQWKIDDRTIYDDELNYVSSLREELNKNDP